MIYFAELMGVSLFYDFWFVWFIYFFGKSWTHVVLDFSISLGNTWTAHQEFIVVLY